MSILTLFKLSIRNIMRQKLRTIFTVMALGIGIAVTVATFSLMRGSYESAFDLTIDNDVGHIQIHGALYEKEQLRKPISEDYILLHVNKLIQTINDIPTIKALGPYLNFSATILAGNHSVPVFTHGVDTFQGTFLDTMASTIKEGTYFAPYNRIAFANPAFYTALGVDEAKRNVTINYLRYDGKPETFVLTVIPKSLDDKSEACLFIPHGMVRAFPKDMLDKKIWEGYVPQFSLKVNYENKEIETVVQTFELDSMEDEKYKIINQQIPLENPLATVILGYKLADALEVGIHDIVRVRTKDTNGMIAAEAYTVIGTFKSGLNYIDESTMYMPLPEARRFLRMEDKATSVKIMLDGRYQVDETMNTLKTRLSQAGNKLSPPMDDLLHQMDLGEKPFESIDPRTLSVEPWTYFAKALIHANNGDWISQTIMIGLIVSLVIFGVMNTMSLSIRQRSRELATLRAIGMHQIDMVKMVFTESITLGICGIILGTGLAWLLSYFLTEHGIPLPQEMMAESTMMMEPVMRGETFIRDYFIAGSIGFFAGVLGSVFPGKFVWNLNVVNGLQERPDVQAKTVQ
jgi:ABC-type lipoprotein release transport system permease subunit